MALLSALIRNAAITGRPDRIYSWVGSRQAGRWADQTVRAAFPARSPQSPNPPPPAVATRPPADPAEALRELTDLHARGVVTDAEFAQLRARLRV
jgi:hypothetical protein